MVRWMPGNSGWKSSGSGRQTGDGLSATSLLVTPRLPKAQAVSLVEGGEELGERDAERAPIAASWALPLTPRTQAHTILPQRRNLGRCDEQTTYTQVSGSHAAGGRSEYSLDGLPRRRLLSRHSGTP